MHMLFGHMYSTGMYGFHDESALYDNTFQPYGRIVVMDADGSNKTILTDSISTSVSTQCLQNRTRNIQCHLSHMNA